MIFCDLDLAAGENGRSFFDISTTGACATFDEQQGADGLSVTSTSQQVCANISRKEAAAGQVRRQWPFEQRADGSTSGRVERRKEDDWFELGVVGHSPVGVWKALDDCLASAPMLLVWRVQWRTRRTPA